MRVVVRGEGLTGGENGRYAKPRTALVCAYRHTCLDGVRPKVDYNLQYLRQQSLAEDLTIILATIR